MLILSNEQLIALLVFIATYLLIATGYRERTIAAMAGVGVLWAFGILDQNEMISYVDLNAIGLLFGMMVIVGALREAQFFKWLGMRIANLCKCRPRILFLVFLAVTAGLSAILDNVTTVLFMVAVTIDITELLGVDPRPYIIGEVITSNMGGSATLIGDPPNIMIAGATGFTFVDFLVNLAPIVTAGLMAAILFLFYYYRKRLETKEKREIPLSYADIVQDWRLFRLGLATLVVTCILFVSHKTLGLAPSVIALTAAAFLLFVGGSKMPQILVDIEWSTLIFFASLFIVVGGLEKTGVIHALSQIVSSSVGTDRVFATSVVLWLSSLGSAFIDNIPFVAAFIPLLKDLSSFNFGGSSLWWALALGAGFGGSGTPIGASANVVATGVAAKRGVLISFKDFMKVGMIVLLISTAIANVLLIIGYFLT
jgi:Na+/H+ antiporter NhaD/arsenite permease-like protein